MEQKTSSLTCIDLFAGAGGFSLAAQNIGLKVLAAIEIDEKACQTYHRNFIHYKRIASRPKLYKKDIQELAPSEIMKDLNIKEKYLDILMGGPPCQGFSTHRIKDKGVNDPRNKLLLRYFDYVGELKPKIFIVENVYGLLWSRHKNYLDKFYEQGKQLGYKLHEPVVLDAKNYGIPQSRKRVFILGIRKDLPFNINWPPQKTHFSPNSKDVLSKGQQAWKTARDIFEKKIKESDPNNIHMNPSPEMVDRFKKTPVNGGSRIESGYTLPCHDNGYEGHKDVYGRMKFDSPANTITTGCTNPSKGRFVHPTEHHGITARHCARFQTFPDNFIFEGGLGHAGRQIGNAVPIDIAKIILNLLKNHIIVNK